MNKKIFTAMLVLFFVFSGVSSAKDQTKNIGKNKTKIQAKIKKKVKPKFKKFEEVITKDAITKKGIITIHQVGDKLFYELPGKIFKQEFLWVTQFSKVQSGFSWAGTPLNNRVVKWERRGDKILLRKVQYRIQAKEGSSEAIAVKASNLPAVIEVFKIICFTKAKTPVIDVTNLFLGDVAEFSPKKSLNAIALDKKKTLINSFKVFSKNVETRILATFKPKPPKNRFTRSTASITVEMHHSMVKLPDTPMMARIADKRIGYFGHTYEEYSGKEQQQVDEISLIHRFGLKKKNPNQELSEPLKPIVFYVGRGVPKKYKKYVKQGIEDWLPAFEQAGFKNAIIGKYAPTVKENPNWDAEDARYSTIRWLPAAIENAMGPHVADPRSGETLEADVLIYHNVLKLARDWFYVQASPSLPDEQVLPLSDDLMGRLLRFIVCHEVGHSIGLRHNFKASGMVSIKQARSAKFTKRYGHTPSIMDYARFNYIAQPGDGASLIPKIGPYDKFAIEWGYKQFKGVKSPFDEKILLNKIAARQLKDPLLRFGFGREAGSVGGADPTAQTEDLGNDAFEASQMGLKNLKRVIGYIVKGTTKNGDDFKELRNMYQAVLNQFYLEMRPVAALVGGVKIHNIVAGMKGNVYTPVNIDKQKEAVKYLNQYYFNLPDFFIAKDVIGRLGMHSISQKAVGIQVRVLRSLLSSYRASLIGDLEATGYKTYPVTEMVGDLVDGIFSEIKKPSSIGILRRDLQRNLVAIMLTKLNDKTAPGDLIAAVRYEMNKLITQLEQFKGKDQVTLSHSYDLIERIKKGLEGKK